MGDVKDSQGVCEYGSDILLESIKRNVYYSEIHYHFSVNTISNIKRTVQWTKTETSCLKLDL